jgi:hypothetical protein
MGLLMFGGVIAIVAGIFSYIVGYGGNNPTAIKIAPILFYPGIISIAIFNITELTSKMLKMRNWFIKQHASATEYKTRIIVVKKQYTDLSKELKELMEKYLEHEKGLIEVIKSRSIEDLHVLLERYPNLKADNSVRNTLDNLLTLRRSVTEVINNHNAAAQMYNAISDQWPDSLFKPSGLIDKIELIDE